MNDHKISKKTLKQPNQSDVSRQSECGCYASDDRYSSEFLKKLADGVIESLKKTLNDPLIFHNLVTIGNGNVVGEQFDDILIYKGIQHVVRFRKERGLPMTVKIKIIPR